MRRFRRSAALAAALAASGALPLAADTLGLGEAMALARERAREVEAAEARQVAHQARFDQAKAQRLPRIGLSEVWMRTDAPAEVFALQLQQERFSFDDFVTSDPNDPDPLSNAMTRLEVSLPVYTGGELSARIRQAELAAEAAGETVVRTGDEAAFGAAESYVRLAQAREHVALLERSLATVDAHVELARAYVEQGMIVRSELLRAEVERSRVEDLLTAAEGQARVAEAALSYRLAVDLGSDWELAALPAPGDLGLELADLLGAAAGRPDLVAARQHELAAALQVDVERAARLPRIGVSARYDLFDEDLFGSGGDNTSIVAMASIDLFAFGRHRAARAAAEADAEAVSADVERFAEGVELEIRQAWERARTALDRHATADASLAAARETERIVEERFRQGVVRTIDLLDAVTSRREAETRELVARSDAHLAALGLALAAGRRPESAIPGSRPIEDHAPVVGETAYSSRAPTSNATPNRWTGFTGEQDTP